MDLRKAYDSLDHCILLQRIKEINVTSGIFQNYLSGRIHYVKRSNELLFLIYVNQLPLQVTDRLLVQYADGTTLICCGPTPEAAAALLNSQLQLVSTFISDSTMMFFLFFYFYCVLYML